MSIEHHHDLAHGRSLSHQASLVQKKGALSIAQRTIDHSGIEQIDKNLQKDYEYS
jgi:hypothetical protein